MNLTENSGKFNLEPISEEELESLLIPNSIMQTLIIFGTIMTGRAKASSKYSKDSEMENIVLFSMVLKIAVMVT